MSQSPTIQETYQRIAAARAQVKIQGGRLTPTANLGAEYGLTKRSQNARPFVGTNGETFDLFTLGLDTAWELDLFGKIERSIESAKAELQFEEFEFESVRQTLLADVASSYLRIRLLQRQIASTNESLAIQSQTEKLVAGRTDAGISTELDQTQTDAFLHRSTAQRAAFEQQLDVEFNLLNLLLGQTPDRQLRTFLGELPLPQIPSIPNVGIPAELLRRRPDIRRDEMAVAAATANIGVATADLYPQLSLLGSISVSAQTVSGLFETDGLGFSVGPSLKWNILNHQRIGFNIEAQEAKFRQAAARYQSTVLTAVNEVEDAMVQHHGYLKQWMSLNEAVTADEKAVALSLERYKAGKANFQRVIDAQQQLLKDRQLRDESQSLAVGELIRLYKASGGGWETGQPSQAMNCPPQMVGTQQGYGRPIRSRVQQRRGGWQQAGWQQGGQQSAQPVMYYQDPVHDPITTPLPVATEPSVFESPQIYGDESREAFPDDDSEIDLEDSEFDDFEFLHPTDEDEETDFILPKPEGPDVEGKKPEAMYDDTSSTGFKPLKQKPIARAVNWQEPARNPPQPTMQPPRMGAPMRGMRSPMQGAQTARQTQPGIQRYPLLDTPH